MSFMTTIMQRLRELSGKRKLEKEVKRQELSRQRQEVKERLEFYEWHIPFLTPNNELKWIGVETLLSMKGINLAKMGYSKLEEMRQGKIEELRSEISLLNKELEPLG